MKIEWRHRIVITGANGQLGRALQLELADGGNAGSWSEGGKNNRLMLYSQNDRRFRQNTIRALDITDAKAVTSSVQRDDPDIIIHCAAWTDTAAAESDPARALAVNGEAAGNVARAAAAVGAAIVHVSTNEVFDGTKGQPYDEDDEPNPINEYGRSKLAGEDAVRAATEKHYVVRTSWVYGPGRVSFPEKIIERAQKDGHVRGVTDEIASPTWTKDLAVGIAQLIETGKFGTYHLTGEGSCSRLEWAQEVLRLAGIDVPTEPATQADFDLPFRKPVDSRLSNNRGAALGIRLRPWGDALADHMQTKQVTDMISTGVTG